MTDKEKDLCRFFAHSWLGCKDEDELIRIIEDVEKRGSRYFVFWEFYWLTQMGIPMEAQQIYYVEDLIAYMKKSVINECGEWMRTFIENKKAD